MFKVQTLNKIDPIINQYLPAEKYEIANEIPDPDAIFVRSASMLEMTMPKSLLAIARAGAGTNNIPTPACSEQGIVVFNTPGANSNAVAEMAICGLFLASRNVFTAATWTQGLKGNGDEIANLVEKGKSQFTGPEVNGKTLGIIGLGAIGGKLANYAIGLGMNVIGLDNYMTEAAKAALNPAVKMVTSLDEILPLCDYFSLHIPATPETKGSFNKNAFAKMKKGARLLNFARADLINVNDLLAALEEGTPAHYVTDFASEAILDNPKITVIPHLGASTPESQVNCAVMGAEQLRDFLELGNIVNSTNFPSLSIPAGSGKLRATVAYQKDSDALTKALAVIAPANYVSAERGNVGYAICEVDSCVSGKLAELAAIPGVLKVRAL